jgi:hypothetical protein
MLRVGRPDKLIKTDIEPLVCIIDHTRDLIRRFFRRNARFFCYFLDFLTVFVGARREKNVIAVHSFEPRDRVGINGIIVVADMGLP